ncbi:MAG: class I SAM-dependent methyltransferase [Gemmatimonadaceae bacterium]
MSRQSHEAYDEAYFDKWYRNPRHRVKSVSLLNRQVAFVLHAAEWVLGRPVRTVLDVGCGEGNWRLPLRKLRPSLKYAGVDPSAYAVQRFGKRRNIVHGSIESLSALSLDGPFDLVVCCGMLNYVPAAQLGAGLKAVSKRTGGLAYLEIFTVDDVAEGDTSWPTPQSKRWYESALKGAGLTSVGLHCYVPEGLLPIAELERAF